MTDELKLPDDDRPDEFVPDPQVQREFGVTGMSIYRFDHRTLHLANGEVIVTDLLTLRDERNLRRQIHWDALQIFPRQAPGEWRLELVATGYFNLAGGAEREHIVLKKGVIPAAVDLQRGLQ